MKAGLHSLRMIFFLAICMFFLETSMNETYAQTWSALPGCSGATNGTIYAAVVLNDQLYVGGDFTTICGVSANRVARYNGANWFALGSGTDNTVRSLIVMGTNIVAGG